MKITLDIELVEDDVTFSQGGLGLVLQNIAANFMLYPAKQLTTHKTTQSTIFNDYTYTLTKGDETKND